LSSDEVVKIKHTMFGKINGEKSCGNCIDLDSWAKDTSSKLSVPFEYQHQDIDSDRGKEYAEKYDVNAIPVSEVCEVYKSGKEECKNYVGPDEVKQKLSSYLKKEVT
jgi:hypothetical protein